MARRRAVPGGGGRAAWGGIPIGNDAGWLVIAGSVAALAERGRLPGELTRVRRMRTPLVALDGLRAARDLRWATQARR